MNDDFLEETNNNNSIKYQHEHTHKKNNNKYTLKIISVHAF